MNAAGVVVEYNPFHNGHLYHLNETKQRSGADIIIAVMSGPFLQRGEPAIASKWTRTQMALEHGADVVAELPYAFATQKAEVFADGAIQILHQLQCRCFCFGSENGSPEPFSEAASRLAEKEGERNDLARTYIKEGLSFPAAQAKARQTLFSSDPLPVDLSQPNNILGFHYVQANKKIGSPMVPLSVLRKGAGFHDTKYDGPIASATAIRQLLAEGKSPAGLMPPQAAARLSEVPLHSWESYWPLLRYRLLTTSPEQLASIYEIEEGIEHRLADAALTSDSFASFMQQVKTKRYTWTRLQRMLVHVLTGTGKEEMQAAAARLSFVRLLGMTAAGRAYMRSVKKQLAVPLISRTAAAGSLLTLDMQAARTYAAAVNMPAAYTSALIRQEFSAPPILL